MGAVTGLYAAARDPRIVAVVAQAAFDNACEALEYRCRQYVGVLARPLLAVLRAGIRIFSKRPDFVDEHLSSSLSGVRVPVLVVHGSVDQFVPIEHSERVFESLGTSDKQLIVVPGGGHISLWKYDFPDYHKKLFEFIERVTA